jgi:hypothetical protein
MPLPAHVVLLCLIAPFLASAAPGSPPADSGPQSYQSIGWLLVCLGSLAVTINQILGVFAKVRELKSPSPGSVSGDRVKALEDRMHTMEISVANHMGGIKSQFDSISQTLTNLQADWNYAIGKIDGRSEASGK